MHMAASRLMLVQGKEECFQSAMIGIQSRKHLQELRLTSLGFEERKPSFHSFCPPSLVDLPYGLFGLGYSISLSSQGSHAGLRPLGNPLYNHVLLQMEIQSRTSGTGHLHRFQARRIGG